MLDLILFPFRLVFRLIAAAGRLIGGVLSLVFGILGGVLSLAVSLGGMLLVIGLVALAIQRRREYRACQDHAQEDFVSFYDKENRVE